jgi:hypothetical protein
MLHKWAGTFLNSTLVKTNGTKLEFAMISNQGAIEVLARKREALRQEREREVALQFARAQAEEKIRIEALREIRTRSLELDQLKSRVDESNAQFLADLDKIIEKVSMSCAAPTAAETSLDHARSCFLQQTEIIRRQARLEALEREQDKANQARSQVGIYNYFLAQFAQFIVMINRHNSELLKQPKEPRPSHLNKSI